MAEIRENRLNAFRPPLSVVTAPRSVPATPKVPVWNRSRGDAIRRFHNKHILDYRCAGCVSLPAARPSWADSFIAGGPNDMHFR